MAAHEALGRQFFHGTNAKLSPGDMLQPNHPSARHIYGGGHEDFVWSSPDRTEAGYYGKHTYEVESTGLMAPHKHNTTTYKGNLISHASDDQRWVSLAPMRVVKKISSNGLRRI